MSPTFQLVRVSSAELEAAPALDQPFWACWLPRLQQQLQADGPTHWLLEAEADSAGPQAQAIAALLAMRCTSSRRKRRGGGASSTSTEIVVVMAITAEA